MTEPCGVFQEWYAGLPMQQQSVLVLACRGPDGVGKFHPTKRVVVMYRACVLKAAYLGRPMVWGEGDDTTFMSLREIADDALWNAALDGFFSFCDEVPHHYYMHLMHGAEIIGYKHPDERFRQRWTEFYLRCCKDLHLTPETESEMDDRLSDWHRRYWDEPIHEAA